MSTVASLSLNMVTSLGAFSKGLKTAGKQVEGFASQATARIQGLAGSFGLPISLSLAGVTAAFAAMTKGGIDRIDALGDSAQRLGVTTEALSKLRYVAELTGSSGEDLDMALTKLNANLGDAAVKATPTGDALKKLGLNARELATMSPDQAFKAISAAMSKVPNAAERASLGMDIFGKSSAKLMNTLTAGPGEFARLESRAESLGIAVSQVDHAKIATTKDSLDDLGFAFEGIGNQFAAELAPAIKVAADMFGDFVGEMGGGKGVAQSLVDGIVKGTAWIADAWFTVKQSFAGVIAYLEEKWGQFLQFFGMGGQSLIDDAKLIRDGLDAQLADGTPGQQIINKYDAFKKKIEESAEAAAKQVEANQKLAKSFKGLAENSKDIKDLESFGKSLYEKTRTPLEKYREEIQKIGDALIENIIDQSTAERAGGMALADLGKSIGTKVEDKKFAGATEFGSKEAYSAILSANSGRSTGMDAIAQTNKEQLAQQTLATKYLAQVADKLSNSSKNEYRLA